jgi:sortase A
MHSRAFVFVLAGLAALVVLTSRPVLGQLVKVAQPTPLPTPTSTPAPPTATPTTDPFGDVPLATPLGGGAMAVARLPAASLGQLPPTFTPTPDNSGRGFLPLEAADDLPIPAPPTPSGSPPERIVIPRLQLDAPVEPVGMVASREVPGAVEWGVPGYKAAGWLDTSAPFGVPGNTVLAGHHNIQGEVFRDLWTLEAGSEIVLHAGQQSRRYLVERVLILPEKGQPLEKRLENARYIQPADDERLTLVSCWPYENNTHRVVVVAFPEEER